MAKYILLLTVMGLTSTFLNAQYSRLSAKEMVAYKFKVFNIDYSKEELLNDYLEEFDQNYSSYRRDEFQLKRNQQALYREFESITSKVDFSKVFIVEGKERFGEYDFTTESFTFDPFKETKLRLDGVSPSLYRKRENVCITVLTGLNFVKELKMPAARAEQFLNSRKSNSYSSRPDRTIYYRIYYSLDSKAANESVDWSYNGPVLIGKPLKVEVWGDRCEINELLAVYYPSVEDLPAECLANYKLLKNTPTNKPSRSVSPPKAGWTNILRSSVFNNETCELEYFDVYAKFERIDAQFDYLLLNYSTSFCTERKTGYKVQFYNTDKGVAYPLAITGINDEGNMMIKISKTTIQQMIVNNTYSLSIQIHGQPAYEVEQKISRVNISSCIQTNNTYAAYDLNETGKKILYNFLKSGL